MSFQTMTQLIAKIVEYLRRLGAALTLLFMIACDPGQLNWQDLKTQIRNQFPSVEHITTTDFKEDYAGNALVVDVRNADEFAVSHIPGAVHFQDADQLADWIKQQPSQPVVVYCSVGYRSAQMAQSLQKHGLQQVVNLEGSIFEWANQGESVVTSTGPTPKVHPFN
ncbi:MAG: rhodanese-like domain-containing protein, partial [Cyanobacteria bacterium P01_A01_bin.17]